MELDLSNNQKILIVNCGSSSIKLTLFRLDLQRIWDAQWKKEEEKSILRVTLGDQSTDFSSTSSLEIDAIFSFLFEILFQHYAFCFSELVAIGHRFVHGGNVYTHPVFLDEEVIKNLTALQEFAPLHHPICLGGIRACWERASRVSQFVVFDTAFHSTLPEEASRYAIADTYFTDYQFKKYGFHGIANHFIWDLYLKNEGKKAAKIVTLHLGSGCSATAISGGKSLDTSMGFTPCEGLVMGTRAGDIDPSFLELLFIKEGKTPSEGMHLLNFTSGLLGVSGSTSHLGKLVDVYEVDEKARIAVDLFCYRIVKYLGAYLSVLEGMDAIIFSGGIGENSPFIREKILRKMEWFGIRLDVALNQKNNGLKMGEIKKISANNTSVAVYVVGVDENYSMANEWIKNLCINKSKK